MIDHVRSTLDLTPVHMIHDSKKSLDDWSIRMFYFLSRSFGIGDSSAFRAGDVSVALVCFRSLRGLLRSVQGEVNRVV